MLLQRFYLVASLRTFPILHTTHAALYLAAKLTETPTKPRNIINATTYILRAASPAPISPPDAADADAYYVDDTAYLLQRVRLLDTETEILKALGYHTHVALPYTLTVHYAQALECLSKPVLHRAFGYLSDALLSPSLVYLTHQPNALAVAALYLAAREEGCKLSEGWWEVFDVEREDLGFLVAVMKGVEEFVRERKESVGAEVVWDGKGLEAELNRRRRMGEP